MDIFLQAFVNAIMLGALYALLAVGLSLIFSTLRIINFAHGQLFMIGAFVVFYIYGEWGQSYYVALLAAVGVVGVISLVLERGFFARYRGQDLASMIVGLGLLLLMEGGALLLFGERDKYVPNPIKGVLTTGLFSVPKMRILILAIAGILVVILFLYLLRAKSGRAMRAVAQDADASSLQGINVNRINTAGFVIGSAMAAIAGGLLLPITKLNPFIGGPLVIKAWIIIILGGMGSIPGSVAGAFLLGFIDSYGFTYWGEGANLIAYALVILILLFRPAGLLGRG